MNKPELEPTQFTTLLGVFFLIMMAVFSVEVMVMQFEHDFFATLHPLGAALLDAGLLVSFVALPLWFFVLNPAFREKIKTDGGYLRIAYHLFIKVLAGLFLIEFIIMLCLPFLVEPLFLEYESLIDGALTVLLSAPLFWWLLYKLEIQYRHLPLADFIESPTTLFILLLFMMFLADMMQEILFSQLDVNLSPAKFRLLDGLVTILFISPLLLILVIKPLRRLALQDKARTNTIYDQVVDAIVKINHLGRIDSFNLAAQKIFGYQAEEINGQPASILLDKDHFDLDEVISQIDEMAAGEALKFHDLSSFRSDGQPLSLNLSISKLSVAGSPEYLLLLHDISERKAVEAALLASDVVFREIFDQTEDAIIIFEPVTRKILDVNQTAETLFGFNKRGFRKQGIEAFYDTATRDMYSNLLKDVEQTGSGNIEALTNDRKDGEPITVSLRGKLMSLQGEQVIFLTARNISERIRLENEAREIQAKLIQTNKMTSLGLLVSGVAHEINNPNNLVLSNAQLLSKIWTDTQLVLQQYFRENGDFMLGGITYTELEIQVPELFHGLTDGSQRINAIVNDLKRFVRQDPAVQPIALDINAVVTSAVSLLHHELVRYTNNFHLNLAEGLPMVNGISQQLGQVVINLLMNACQALPGRDCSVSLQTSFQSDVGQVWIEVRDQGSGLPAGLEDKILESFFSTKRDSGGTGLGLAISLSIIKDHGGQLDFHSQPETGTTFIVKLPVEA